MNYANKNLSWFTIPIKTEAGPGLYIGHYGGIIISPHVSIVANCKINHNVTIVGTYRGARKGYPKIMDNCYVGPGASIIGDVIIKNNCVIGTNVVVFKSLPPNSVYAPQPSVVLSEIGSRGYVINIDYPDVSMK